MTGIQTERESTPDITVKRRYFNRGALVLGLGLLLPEFIVEKFFSSLQVSAF